MVHVIAGGVVAPENDFILPFFLDGAEPHGKLVRLGPALEKIKGNHTYPKVVAYLLAESLTLTALLASALKFEGVLSLQAKGDGAVSLLVCDATDRGELRGYARFNPDLLPSYKEEKKSAVNLLGEGYLAFTVNRGVKKNHTKG